EIYGPATGILPQFGLSCKRPGFDRLNPRVGKGNIVIHSRKDRLYKCTVCGKTFSARKGTIFHRRRAAEETITQVLTLVAHG
ncbi:MAG: hypothetical protein ACPL7G_12065, partial [Chloroflexia bacterium]